MGALTSPSFPVSFNSYLLNNKKCHQLEAPSLCTNLSVSPLVLITARRACTFLELVVVRTYSLLGICYI